MPQERDACFKRPPQRAGFGVRSRPHRISVALWRVRTNGVGATGLSLAGRALLLRARSGHFACAALTASFVRSDSTRTPGAGRVMPNRFFPVPVVT